MSEIRNAGLYNVKSGDQDFEVEIDLNKARQGGRDHFLPGRFLFEITKASWDAKSGDKPGRNLTVVARCVGPEGCSECGKMNTRSIPAPAGTEDAAETGERMTADLLASVMSFAGKLQAVMDNQGGKLKFSPRKLVGKHFGAEVVEGQPFLNKQQQLVATSDIRRYLLKEDYDARNGVDLASAAQTQQSTTPAASGPAKQAPGPVDLLAGGNGQAANTSAAPAAATPAGAANAADALIGI